MGVGVRAPPPTPSPPSSAAHDIYDLKVQFIILTNEIKQINMELHALTEIVKISNHGQINKRFTIQSES